MMRLGRFEIALALTLGITLIASGTVIFRLSRRLAAYRQQSAADQQSLRKLREALGQRELPQTPAEEEGPTPAGGNQAALSKRNATIEQLNRELGEAQATISELQTQLSNSTDELQKAIAAANDRQRKEQEDWQSKFDALKQEFDSAQAASQASHQRIAALEAESAKLKSDSSAGSKRAAEFGRLVADLQDLDRRRDVYLTSIMRRYRDITNQFRAMSGMLDSSRDPSSSAFSGAELARIQNAVSLADDDLRQLSELNAQARQLEKKLANK